jgi:hypothetical protein
MSSATVSHLEDERTESLGIKGQNFRWWKNRLLGEDSYVREREPACIG